MCLLCIVFFVRETAVREKRKHALDGFVVTTLTAECKRD